MTNKNKRLKSTQRILKARTDFDRYLSGIKDQEIKEYAHFVRNIYSSYAEMDFDRKIPETFSVIFRTALNKFSAIFTKYSLSKKSEVTLLKINKKSDTKLAEDINATPADIIKKFSLNIKKFYILGIWAKVSLNMIFAKELDAFYKFKCLPHLLSGIHCYKTIDLSGTKLIITQRDRYPVEYAIIKKAKEMKIKTVKTENYPYLEKICRDETYCDYFLSPNKMSTSIMKSFRCNKKVEFIECGLPYWDSLYERKVKLPIKTNIISFWTNYADTNIFERNSEFYIEEILSVLPSDYTLLIKVHPLDNSRKYLKYVKSNVKIIKHGDMDNREIVQKSRMIFSICSLSTLEAKHTNPNSFFINYDKNIDYIEYGLVDDIIDRIKNRKELEEFVIDKKKPKDMKKFLKVFNPYFPHSSRKVSETIKKIIKK